MRRKAVKIITFLAILAVLLGYFTRVFQFKYGDGIYPLEVFYEAEEGTIDVMSFGSSHVFENVNTGILWDSYGIASFNLCGSVQPFWNTYYYMKEALKTQAPKLMIVDMFGAVQTEDYSDHSRIIKNNYGLRLSMDKIESVKVSAPEGEQLDYLLEYPTYHSRYSEITRQDFKKYLGKKNWESWKGLGINTATAAQKPIAVESITDTAPMTEKTEKYLYEIMDLAKEREIPLLLIVTPYNVSAAHQRIYNEVGRIAQQESVPFINFNFLINEIGLSYESDFADSNHLNHRGNVKFTQYLGDYIKNNYDIPDKRGDEGYDTYDIMAADCRQRIADQTLRETTDFMAYMELLDGDGYTVAFSASKGYQDLQYYPTLREELLKKGIDLDESTEDSSWVIHQKELVFSSGYSASYEWHETLSGEDKLMLRKEGESSPLNIQLNHTKYPPAASGINIFVYDNFTGELVEYCSFNGATKTVKK